MKKVIFALILPLIVASGVVFATLEFGNETSNKSIQKPLSIDQRNAERKKWEATPAGILYKEWEVSHAGIKVYAAEAKINNSIRNNTNMEGVVTSLSLPKGAKVGFGVMVRINSDDYILSFGIETPGKNIMNFKSEFDLLRTLKVNDKIIIKSQHVSHAPKYAYPIITGNYVEREGKIVYKRSPRKGGC